MDKVFTVIATFNGKEWYDKCFMSLQESTIPLKTIVIDNASNDDSVAYIRKKFPEIKLLESNKNLGFGQANNIGIRYALENGADYIFLLNQDAWIETNTVKTLIKVQKDNPEYGIVSPIHLNAQKNRIDISYIYFLTRQDNSDMNNIISDFYFGIKKSIYEIKFIHAAAWLISRKCLNIVGGFDPIFFHFGEDNNYAQRTIYHGLKMGICPLATVCHDTEKRIIDRKLKEGYEKVLLIVRFTDVNREKININKHVLYLFYQCMVNFIKRNFQLSCKYFKQAILLFNNRSRIKMSRDKNKQIGLTWIT